MGNLLKVENLEKRYAQRTILSHFNLNVEEGEMIAIVGASGSGKSTLLHILGLLEPFDGGSYKISAESSPKVNSHAATKLRRSFISYLFQNYALVENMTVQKNLEMSLKYIETENKVNTMLSSLNSVGLAESVFKQKVYSLSGGEQQRVSLARAILKPFSILLADEPTGSLDEENKQIIINQLIKIHESNKTIVIVTHDKELAAICDRTISIEVEH